MKILTKSLRYRRCWRTTPSFPLVCSWPSSGSSPTKKFPKLKTKHLTRSPLSSRFRTNRSECTLFYRSVQSYWTFWLGELLNANDVWQEPGELRQQHRSDQHRLWPAPSALSRWEEAWQPPDEWVLQLYEYDCESQWKYKSGQVPTWSAVVTTNTQGPTPPDHLHVLPHRLLFLLLIATNPL